MLLRRVLRRRLVRISVGTGVLRRGAVIEGALKALRRQKHALSQSTTPFACTLETQRWVLIRVGFPRPYPEGPTIKKI